MLISLEGIDGAGKTTVAARLAEALGAVLLREPGGVALSERIRALVKDPALHVDPRAEALLYAAARAQLVAEQLRPRLAAGETVVLDRFVDSSLAYQGAGRGLGVEEIRRLNLFGTGGLLPDRTLLLRIDPEVGARPRGRARRGRRPARAGGARLLRRDRGGLRRARGRRAGALRRDRRGAAARRGAGGLPGRARRSVRDSRRGAPVPGPGVGDHVVEASRAARQPSCSRARVRSATSAGGSPGRRASSTAGIGSPGRRGGRPR